MKKTNFPYKEKEFFKFLRVKKKKAEKRKKIHRNFSKCSS